MSLGEEVEWSRWLRPGVYRGAVDPAKIVIHGVPEVFACHTAVVSNFLSALSHGPLLPLSEEQLALVRTHRRNSGPRRNGGQG